ncbi:hypothetical protein FRX31_028696 [Thalictrum thalictroides]|uniref:Uncharacterized protein n=1 Tax=Thalictrum thalictroides TaxID=46969 RepID=A0A7J6VAB6_THATH|nr:hypothetical protein FRX31_028696 [Thalictrum thalictroides]
MPDETVEEDENLFQKKKFAFLQASPIVPSSVNFFYRELLPQQSSSIASGRVSEEWEVENISVYLVY